MQIRMARTRTAVGRQEYCTVQEILQMCINAARLFLRLLCRFLRGLLAQRLLLQHLNGLSHLLPLGGSLLLPLNLPLSPPPPVPEVLFSRTELGRSNACRLDQSSDAPVVLSVTVVASQSQQSVGFACLDTGDLGWDAGWRYGRLGRLGTDCVSSHVESALALSVAGIWKGVFLVENYADVFAVGVSRRIAVVLHVSCSHRMDRMVTSHLAILAGPPQGSSLLVDDVAGDYELVCKAVSRLLCTGQHPELLRTIPPIRFAPSLFGIPLLLFFL